VSDSRVSRRTLLLAAGSAVAAAGLTTGVSGCEAAPVSPDPPTEAAIDPLTPVLIGQQALVQSYQVTLSAFPQLAVQLSDLQSQTTAHTNALSAAAPAAASQATVPDSGTDPPAASSSMQPVPPPVPPPDPATAVSDLARVVDAAARRLRAAALRADGDLAALLGSCAASTACHGRLLG